ncbi:MAG: GNAT family N-acetyltransferase [Trueperaceae bacterium]
MNIQRVTSEQRELLAPLFDAYRQFYKQQSDVGAAKTFLSERLTKSESVIFLATENMTGLGFTQLYPSFSSVLMKRLWILNDLFVAPEGRRKGVAEALITAAVNHAKETGAKGLQLETAITNVAAQTLYEKLGWQRETEFYAYHFGI